MIKSEYVNIGFFNIELFAELLDKARGSRTMEQFAIECETNPSTFSRIYRKQNKKASSLKLLEMIAKHADPDSGVTLEALLKANGYEKVDPTELRQTMISRMEHDAYNIIASNIIDQFQPLESRDVRFRLNNMASLKFDLSFDDITFGDKTGKWFFDFYLRPGFSVAGRAIDFRERRSVMHETRLFMERLGRYFAAYCNQEKTDEIVRISMVCFEKESFDSLVDRFGAFKTDDSISFVLIDLVEKRVVEEYVLPDRNGNPGKKGLNTTYQLDDIDMDYDSLEGDDGIIWDDNE